MRHMKPTKGIQMPNSFLPMIVIEKDRRQIECLCSNKMERKRVKVKQYSHLV